MSRKRLSLAVLVAAFALILGTTDAQARGYRGSRGYSTRGYGARIYSTPGYGSIGYGPRGYGNYSYGPRGYGGISTYGFGIRGY